MLSMCVSSSQKVNRTFPLLLLGCILLSSVNARSPLGYSFYGDEFLSQPKSYRKLVQYSVNNDANSGGIAQFGASVFLVSAVYFLPQMMSVFFR